MNLSINGVKNIDINNLDEILGSINLIDIREVYEYEEGTLKTAINIPMGKILEYPEEYLNKDEKYYIMCRSGARSLNTCLALKKEGYQVINVAGGIIRYTGDNEVKVK